MPLDNSLTPPRRVALLGYGGLLPFVLLALASAVDPHHAPVWGDALFGYGAIILSFVGALHWGLAMSHPEMSEHQRSAAFLWSIVPALLAWPSLFLPPMLATPVLVAGFAAHYGMDRHLARQVGLPGWYLPLRLRLSSVASLCLVGGAFAVAA